MRKIINGKAVEVPDGVDVSGPDVKLALAALAPLFNPEPHPFQQQWSDAHSMNRADLLTAVTEAIAVGRAEGHAAGRAEVEQEWENADIDRSDRE